MYFIGVKPLYKPLNLKGVYAGIHQPFRNGLQTHAIVSMNRQFESEMQKAIPTFTGKDVYASYEAEIAYTNACRRVSTGTLNDVIADLIAVNEPPTKNGRRLKIYYTSFGMKFGYKSVTKILQYG